MNAATTTQTWPSELKVKIVQLRKKIREMGSVIVAFSAGVDSTLVAFIAGEELGEKALAVTATSPSFPERELREAQELANILGFRHRVIRSQELANPHYAHNPTNRCYHCKTELYGLLRQMADQEGFKHILDGTNMDDVGDFRPGRKAAKEQGVESPLQELGFTKEQIRLTARLMGLKVADKPAFACLASRFPYGRKITADALRAVDRAENGLRNMGFRQVRVRVHGDIARMELLPADIAKVMDESTRLRIVGLLKSCGYTYITLDLQGYRHGSLNEILKG